MEVERAMVVLAARAGVAAYKKVGCSGGKKAAAASTSSAPAAEKDSSNDSGAQQSDDTTSTVQLELSFWHLQDMQDPAFSESQTAARAPSRHPPKLPTATHCAVLA